MMEKNDKGIRLNRFMAMCGVAARRKVEDYIYKGRVSINDAVVMEPGRRVHKGDKVYFDGKELSCVPPTYLVYNKPKNLLCAVEDSREQTIIDVLPPTMDYLRLFPVGRLDKMSEGIIILTNDGMFAQELMHPSNGILKTYEVTLKDYLTEEKLREWRSGILVNGKMLTPVSVHRNSTLSPKKCFNVVLADGVKREIREMVKALGGRVEKLERVQIGNLKLRNLEQGNFIAIPKDKLMLMIRNGGIV